MIQVCWRGLGPGQHAVTAGPAKAVATGRAGAVDVQGLAPDTEYDVAVDGRSAGRVRTLRPPEGRELYRFATVNDVHIGERAFGFRRTIREADAAVPYAQRCLRAALDEAHAWGAARMVVKGDLTDDGRLQEFEIVADELGHLAVPVNVVLGNHDVRANAAPEGIPTLRAAGLDVVTEPEAIDVPGLRIVLAPTARVGDGHGHVTPERRDAIVALVAEATTPVFVAVHHYPQRWRFPTAVPRGITGTEAQPLLDGIQRAKRDTVFVSGHSHRHRLRHHGAMPVVEVGSTKDYPGAWAGYVVYEGGIRQVVRRVAEPSALAWTERTRRTLFGLWGLWSPGTRRHRCWALSWSDR